MDLWNELRQRVIQSGASEVSSADLSDLPGEVRDNLPRAVTFLVALRPEIIAGIRTGPTEEYVGEYDRVNALLNDIADTTAGLLRTRGFRAEPIASTTSQYDPQHLATALPHKTSALRGGLGWIGRCALLITEQYGSAVRLGTVLTDAPLPTGPETTESSCGECTECVTVCPGSAPRGGLWRKGMRREDIFDAHACQSAMHEQAPQFGISREICGLCIACCPLTLQYLRRAGAVRE